MKSYSNVRGNECLTACIIAYMKYCGLHINESDIFLAGKGYRISYSGNIYDVEIGADAYEAVYRFVEKYEVPYSHGRIKKEYAVSSLDDAADREQMISVRVSTSRLTYDNVYKSIKAPHWISVIGRTKDNYIIADNAIPGVAGKVYLGDIGKEELISAWEELGYEYFLLGNDIRNVSGIEKVIKEDAETELNQGLIRYFNPKRHIFTSKREGTDAAITLFRDLKSLNIADRGEILSVMRMISYRARIGGIVSYKNVIYEKFCELGIENELLKEYQDNISVWNKIFMQLFKAGIRCDEVLIERIMDMAKEAVEKEKKIYESYLQWQCLVRKR